MKKLAIITIFLSLFLSPSWILSKEATESSQNNSLTDKIKEKLQETAEDGLDNIREEIISKSKIPKKKAFIGSIKSIEETSLSIEYKSQVFIINLNEETEIIKSSGSTAIDLEDLEVDDYIITMGFVSPESTQLDAKRVLLISAPKTPSTRQLLSGKINEVDGNKISFDSKSIVITSKTNLSIQDIEEPEVEDIELDDNLFSIVTLDNNGDIDTANQVLILPGKNNPASQEPTNSAEASNSADATESATIEE